MSQLENKKPPLDPSSALRMRPELHKMVVADLLGPAGGEEETVEEATAFGLAVCGRSACAQRVSYNLDMRHTATITGEQLASALHTLGVNFIRGGNNAEGTLGSQPSRLISALAQSSEARLRLSLIPLFLEHPEYAARVRAAAKKLDPFARLTLQCYYSAAVWLGMKYQLRVTLPDYFSQELRLTPIADPEENLRALANRHAELSGSHVNWLATYQHAEQIWRKGFERRRKVTHG